MCSVEKIVRLRHNLLCHVRIHFKTKEDLDIRAFLFSLQRELHAVAFLNQGSIRTLYEKRVVDITSESVQSHAIIETARNFALPNTAEEEENMDRKPELQLSFKGSMTSKIIHIYVQPSDS